MTRELSLAVVGADFSNKKGPSRRFEIAMCKPGESVDLVREPRNPKDPHAIAVYSCRSIQIGYVRAERAPYVGAEMNRGIVTAIFQRPEAWGATIRVGLDGAIPVLSVRSDRRDDEESTCLDRDDNGWWPDDEPEWVPDE